jgi:hypothetical protein
VVTIRTARGKTCLRFARTFHLCIPDVSYKKQQISPHTAFTCVFNGRTLCSLRGTQLFFYRSQKPVASLQRKLASATKSPDSGSAQVSDERRDLYEMNLYMQRTFMQVFKALQ